MVLSTNTLSVSLATQWATAMQEHAQYESLNLESLSLVIQYTFSADTSVRRAAFLSAMESYPQFLKLSTYNPIAPSLSVRISNAFSLCSRLPIISTEIPDYITQMKKDVTNLTKWMDDYLTDARTYL